MVDPLVHQTIPPSPAEPKGQRDFALHPATSARTRCIHRASVNRIMPIVSNRFSKRAGGHGGPPLRGDLFNDTHHQIWKRDFHNIRRPRHARDASTRQAQHWHQQMAKPNRKHGRAWQPSPTRRFCNRHAGSRCNNAATPTQNFQLWLTERTSLQTHPLRRAAGARDLGTRNAATAIQVVLLTRLGNENRIGCRLNP